jgi:flagellar protein FliS
MPAANPWKSYRQVATQTAPPGQLVLMLFQGAISSLEKSLPGFEIEDPSQSISTIHNNVEHALEIIRELNRALNMEQGGECAITLRRLYNYFERRLNEGNVRTRRDAIIEVIGHITVLRDAWAEMLAKSVFTPVPESNVFGKLITA